MSVRMMSLVWELDLPDSEKLVLLALADWADDEGKCWPSIGKLAKKCSKGERTVQVAIRTLCAKGHLTQYAQCGKRCDYIVHPIVRFADPRSGCTPAETAPPQGTTQTPAAAAPNTLVTVRSSSQKRAWHRLPEDFLPRPLPAPVQAKVDQWPPGALDDEFASFRRWAANADDKNGKGRKLDWDQAWRNWIGRRHDERYGRIGMGRHQPANDGLSSTARAALAVFGQAGTGH